ncbi:type I-E CRISPR-associated protein Cse1/CasA [Streptomyces tsukubensis]
MTDTDLEATTTAPGTLSFDLTARPWIPVLWRDGTQSDLSLREVFARADEVHCVAGELPTLDFALTRLLLALAHDALDGPRDTEHWGELWADRGCFAPLADYLDEHAERFDLLHPRLPFLQAAGLRTAHGEVFSLNRIVADVPNGEPFFSSRMPDAGRLEFAEAARWVVHAHAYDTSGIKTGIDGDPRVRSGKVYPLGVGWAGTLGGVLVEGASLRETLLLNLIATDGGGMRWSAGDLPAWRQKPYGPGPADRPGPKGPRELYTWQTRRLRLHFDAQGVHGVVLGYGDPLAPHNKQGAEPMTAWRRSPAQEKKRGESPVYLPREHDPARSVWRGLEALITPRSGPAGGGAEPPSSLRPGVLEWVARLVTEGELPRGLLVRTRTVGVVYGTQQSVVDEVVDDRLAMSVVLLHEQSRPHAQQAKDAVADAEQAVTALGDLATDLARASGGQPEGPRAAARARGFAELDDPYRAWLRQLTPDEDPFEHRVRWQQEAHRRLERLGRQLVHESGDKAWAGRVVDGKKGKEWLHSGSAEKWFRIRLAKALSHPFSPGDDGPPNTDSEPTPKAPR